MKAPLPPSIIAMLGRSDSSVKTSNEIAKAGMAERSGDNAVLSGMSQPAGEACAGAGLEETTHSRMDLSTKQTLTEVSKISLPSELASVSLVGIDRDFGVLGEPAIGDFHDAGSVLNLGSLHSMGMPLLPLSPPLNAVIGELGR